MMSLTEIMNQIDSAMKCGRFVYTVRFPSDRKLATLHIVMSTSYGKSLPIHGTKIYVSGLLIDIYEFI